ncbi:MAG: FGGY-family carbohydrate kinase [Christensenellaceae bacterium]|nr:FGGY-family carbohydrate kinase [Christensenellaceae bacterium]
MDKKIIAWDLGTGGSKASLYSVEGECLAQTFISYDTYYPAVGWHEQRPDDWWNAVVQGTKQLIEESGANKEEITCCGISGHSLGTICISKDGELLNPNTPIWSDGRATEQAAKVFENYDKDKWYMTTGNGFNPAFYTSFKLLWYRDNMPEMFEKIYKVIGTKDYINYKMTGRLCTDPSYASGCGVWDLKAWDYSDELIAAMDLPKEILPEVIPSTGIVGTIKPEIAEEMGLTDKVQVVCGGVDNSCMALGAMAYKEGRVYNSLGSSSWIAVSSQEPVLDVKKAPYVFTHVVPGYYASALCVNAGGTAFRWMRDALCQEFVDEADKTGADVYDLMTAEAAKSEMGAHGLIFNPSLGGGAPMDKSVNIRASFIGLDLIHTRADIIRASMEGITMGLRRCLDALKECTEIGDEMLLVGGGSKSAFWRQIYADIYKVTALKSNIDQQAAALGAAACAAVGTGLWENFDKIDELHHIEERVEPIPENMAFYDEKMEIFNKTYDLLCDIGDIMTKN